jgi:hypothetical protein
MKTAKPGKPDEGEAIKNSGARGAAVESSQMGSQCN